MFLEKLAITILSMVFILPFAVMILQWFCEQIEEMLAMRLEDWIAVALFLGVAVVITLIA